MFFQLKFPANAQMFNVFLSELANFDLFDSWKNIDQEFFYDLSEDDAYNLNFEQCGYESKYLIHNASLVIWTCNVNITMFLLLCIFKLIARCTNKLASITQKLTDYLLFNGLIRLFMEVFL
jgi:hypothetical protein